MRLLMACLAVLRVCPQSMDAWQGAMLQYEITKFESQLCPDGLYFRTPTGMGSKLV